MTGYAKVFYVHALLGLSRKNTLPLAGYVIFFFSNFSQVQAVPGIPREENRKIFPHDR